MNTTQTQSDVAGRPPETARRRGFSLVEVLLSLGIMGVGLTMVAAIFPVAIKEANDSSSTSVGSIICDNGLAVARAAMSSPVIDWGELTYSSSQTVSVLGFADTVTNLHITARLNQDTWKWPQSQMLPGATLEIMDALQARVVYTGAAPDLSGVYMYDGKFNNFASYRRTDAAYLIRYDGSRYSITKADGTNPVNKTDDKTSMLCGQYGTTARVTLVDSQQHGMLLPWTSGTPQNPPTNPLDITIYGKLPDWRPKLADGQPDTTRVIPAYYRITRHRQFADSGVTTASSPNALSFAVDSNKNWTMNQWVGYYFFMPYYNSQNADIYGRVKSSLWNNYPRFQIPSFFYPDNSAFYSNRQYHLLMINDEAEWLIHPDFLRYPQGDKESVFHTGFYTKADNSKYEPRSRGCVLMATRPYPLSDPIVIAAAYSRNIGKDLKTTEKAQVVWGPRQPVGLQLTIGSLMVMSVDSAGTTLTIQDNSAMSTGQTTGIAKSNVRNLRVGSPIVLVESGSAARITKIIVNSTDPASSNSIVVDRPIVPMPGPIYNNTTKLFDHPTTRNNGWAALTVQELVVTYNTSDPPQATGFVVRSASPVIAWTSMRTNAK